MEDADHSLQYMVGVALIDGTVLPAQYAPDRIVRNDIQGLLKRFTVKPKQEYTDRFPDEVCTDLAITLKDGPDHRITKTDYEGFSTRPMSWDTVISKFIGLSADFTSDRTRKAIIDAVQNVEQMRALDFAAILSNLDV